MEGAGRTWIQDVIIYLRYLPNDVYILHYNFALGMTSGSYTARPRLSLGTGTRCQSNSGVLIPI